MVIYGVYVSRPIFRENGCDFNTELLGNGLFIERELAEEFANSLNKESETKFTTYIVKEVNLIEPEKKCPCGNEISQHSKDIKNYVCCDCMTKKLIGNNWIK